MNPFLFLAQSQPSPIMEFVDKLARTPLSKLVIFIAVLTVIRVALMAYLNKTPKHMRSGPFSAAKFVNETCDALVYAGGLVFLLIRPFALQTFYVPSGSMLETLQLNDFLIGNKWVTECPTRSQGRSSSSDPRLKLSTRPKGTSISLSVWWVPQVMLSKSKEESCSETDSRSANLM